MKAFFYILVIIAGLVFGAKVYYEKQIESNLNQFAEALEPIAEFSYEKAGMTPEGNLSISGMRLKPVSPNTGPTISIDEFIYRTESFFNIYKLDNQLKSGEIPERLNAHVRGLTIPLNVKKAVAKNTSDQNTSQDTQLTFAGCGDVSNFYTYNQQSLKKKEIKLDVDLDINMPKKSRTILVDSKINAESFYSLHAKLNVYSGVYDLDRESLIEVKQLAELDGFSINYEDKGYFKGIFDFCVGHAGMSEASYIAYHTNAWIKQWLKHKLRPDAVTTEAYMAFLESPKNFSITVSPKDRLNLASIFDLPRGELIELLNAKVEINGASPLALSFTSMRPRKPAAAQAPSKAPEKDRAASEEAAEAIPTEISETSAAFFINRSVKLTLKGGKTYQGDILVVTARKIDLERNIGNGKFVMPILLEHIKSFELLD